MKKSITVVSALFLVVVLAAIIGWYAYPIYRGAKPALLPAPQDIAVDLGQTQTSNQDSPLKLPPGFSIRIFASGLSAPRVLTQDPAGRLLVSIPSSGKVVAFDKKNDGSFDPRPIETLKGLNYPHGLAFECPGTASGGCRLFVGETDAVRSFDYDPKTGKATNPVMILDLPSGGNHITRTLKIIKTTDGDKLLISVGSSCNVCNEKDWRRAKILIANLDGSGLRTYASGLRNSVFMADDPVTGQLWAADMGRDLLGDDIPPDEINIIVDGKDYGWPYCYGKQIQDKNFDASAAAAKLCQDSVPSHIDIQAHSAPLGLAFVPKEGWPAAYSRSFLVAYHGSWNRSVPTGYKVVRYDLDEAGDVLSTEDFITGWLTKDGALGRPVGLLALPGGKLYISDDKAGVIYEVTYKNP